MKIPSFIILSLALAAISHAAAPSIQNLDACNLVWEGPSKQESFDSMPLGNGDVGVNVWFEANGDILAQPPA